MSGDPLAGFRETGLSPRPAFIQRVDGWARRLAPGMFICLVVLFLSAPTGLPAVTALLPSFVLASVFFWSVWMPQAMPPPGVFMLGLLLDLIGFSPPGVSALTLLLLHGAAMRFRFSFMRMSFAALWIVFAFCALCACLFQWFVTSALSLSILPLSPSLFETLLAAGLYPPLAAGSIHVCRWLSGQDPKGRQRPAEYVPDQRY
ncbi:rod shape-determining protein MreD [Acetobacter sp. AN02]|uniref:rod shape-determining protein MreD n=1 Tax=Acetobacter sp. AN02 TaxID=2894186 RepID=UPI0024345E8D|nr:rod shape-determining protein MreD [Acetobacter sp. AN02]MDG6094324.1 rod shape-determining protein MreD [Acetobacter sp. AN02]